MDRREAIKPEITITFQDPLAMVEVLTAERLRLVQKVRTQSSSITALAAAPKRDPKSVRRDVLKLERAGVVRTRQQINPGHGRVKIVEPVGKSPLAGTGKLRALTIVVDVVPSAPIQRMRKSRSRCRGIMVGQSNIGSSLAPKELVVFDILRDSKCSECGKELWKGEFLFMEGERPLCLSCADFDHLVYLPRGDAALTRRAKKYSALSAIVVRFSGSRARYEREGILVEEVALERAEQECLSIIHI